MAKININVDIFSRTMESIIDEGNPDLPYAVRFEGISIEVFLSASEYAIIMAHLNQNNNAEEHF